MSMMRPVRVAMHSPRQRIALQSRFVQRSGVGDMLAIGLLEQHRVCICTSSLTTSVVGASPFSTPVGYMNDAATTTPPPRTGRSPAAPSPVEVHQVIARAVRSGKWEHAIRLLLGALHSHSVPLAETYQLTLLAALRGGGWRSTVQLTTQVATSALSAAALYHTVADLLLKKTAFDVGASGNPLDQVVLKELVPLMLDDSTQHIVWRPRHREAVLRVLERAQDPQQMSALFRRWTMSASFCTLSPPRYSAEEATLLMEAFSITGDWCSAEALRSSLSQVSDPLLVKYVKAFAVAVHHAGTRKTEEPQQLVPWEIALDVAAKSKQDAQLQAAVTELLNMTRRVAAPADAAGWWWTPSTPMHARLTELYKLVAIAVPEAARFLVEHHLTIEEAKRMLDAVRVSGVLHREGFDAPARYVGWVKTVLVLCKRCPHALVSADGCADGLVQLLPHPHGQVHQAQDNATPEYIALWQYVTQSVSDSDVAYPGNAARLLVYSSSVLHYVRHAALLPAQLTKAGGELVAALGRQLCSSSPHRTTTVPLTRFEGKSDALCVFLRTISACIKVPEAEQCVRLMLCDETSRPDELVDVQLLSFLKALDALGTPAEVSEAVCAAGEAFLTSSSSLPHSPCAQLACLAVWYTCHQLQRGVSMVTLRPALSRVDTLARRLPRDADALLLLSAHLQWLWGASLEALRAQAVPILARHEAWNVLVHLLKRFPHPLSTREQRLLTRCEGENKVERLMNLVREQSARAAWNYWQCEIRGAGHKLPLPMNLCDSFVSLLLSQGLVSEAHAVLASGALSDYPVTCTTWSHAGLRIYDYARRRRQELGMQLGELWDVVGLGEGVDGDHHSVRRREAALTLSLYAALALEHTQRAADAAQLVSAAVEYVQQYDRTRHHCNPQSPRDSTALHKTDAQLAACLPDYVQCVAPRLITLALGLSDGPSSSSAMNTASVGVDSDAVSAALQTAMCLFPLTSMSEAAVIAWSETMTRLYTTVVACATDATPAVVALGQRVLLRAVERNVAVEPSYLRLVLSTGLFSQTLLAAARQCLLLTRGKTAPSTYRADIAATAVYVAHSLAGRGDYCGALEWVEEFELWPGVEDAGRERAAEEFNTFVDSAAHLSWIRAAHWSSQRLSNQRAALCQSRREAQDAVGGDSVPYEHYSLSALDRLIDVDAWEEALDTILYVASASPGMESLFSEEAMRMMEVRDACLSADVLNSVMHCVARCAPWQTTVQAWMLLTSQVPFLPWGTCATVMTPSLRELLHAMVRQGALPHEIGTVVAWIVMRMDLPTSATSAFSSLFEDCISSSSSAPSCAWTAAEMQLCAEIVAQLRRLGGEQRVQEAELGIVESRASSHSPTFPHVACLSEGPGAQPMPPLAKSWLPPGLPPLSPEELDTLAVVAPLLLLASAPQLELLAGEHLDGRFQAHELKALLHLYKKEISKRVDAVRDPDASLVQYLTQNPTLLVLLSQWWEERRVQSLEPRNGNTAAAEWMAQHVFDDLLPLCTARELWKACEEPARKLAGCRWSAVAEEELCHELLLRNGKIPTKLRTAPQLTRQDIAHYWSCFHRLLLPGIHFGPLELFCLATYVPALAEVRAKCPEVTQPVYVDAVAHIANHAYLLYFCPSRVPVEDTLSYLRRPHSPATIAAVMTSAFKKLKQLHTQLSEAHKTAERGYQLPFECNARCTAPEHRPLKLDHIAAPRRRVTHKGTPAVGVAPVLTTVADLKSPLLRQWTRWAMATVNTGSPKLLPPEASLLLVEWTKEALQSDLGAPRAAESCSTVLTAVEVKTGEARALWRQVAQAGKRELQQCRCRELSVVWRILSEADVWSVMDAGHVTVLRKLVCPSVSKVAALPPKRNASQQQYKR